MMSLKYMIFKFSQRKELFTSVGPLKYCQIDWDNLGRSKVMPNEISYIFKGTAVVEYENEEDAERAVKEFNGLVFKIILIC